MRIFISRSYDVLFWYSDMIMLIHDHSHVKCYMPMCIPSSERRLVVVPKRPETSDVVDTQKKIEEEHMRVRMKYRRVQYGVGA